MPSCSTPGAEPALAPWRPPDGLEDVRLVRNVVQEVLFTDGTWRRVRIIAQGRSRRGWAVKIGFYTDDGYEHWFQFDRAKFRNLPEARTESAG